MDVRGEFEIHLTVAPEDGEKARLLAEQNAARFSWIVLDRGVHPSQPMLTVAGRGGLDDQHAEVERWRVLLAGAGVALRRAKIEASPTASGVPVDDPDPMPGRYFEHHVKLRLPDTEPRRLALLTDLVTPHHARLSLNARRTLRDGTHHRFVTQRCPAVGLTTAGRRLDALLASLASAAATTGHEVVEVEREYVVHDSAVSWDDGWLDGERPAPAPRWRPAGGRAEYPPSFLPITEDGVDQGDAFDPALKHHGNAYRVAEPSFADARRGQAWRDAREAALRHVLEVLGASPWAEHLVVRGSATMAAWVGPAARPPGDLDFVVTPSTLPFRSPEAATLVDGVLAALLATPGAGLRPDRAVGEDIWTYERAPGQRLVVPFAAEGLPDGSVQLDLVFGEDLPEPPVRLALPGVTVGWQAASPSLSLAWKLMWLGSDGYPQGKDLYDAVLLAEYTPVDPRMVRDLLSEVIGDEADEFGPESVWGWDVDWQNFTDEYPAAAAAAGDRDALRARLHEALRRSFTA